MIPLVSIIIPVYNCEQFLADCIESVIYQTWQNKEIIIINDGSTDLSLSIAKKYEADFNYINVYTQNNSGASNARNLGLYYAKGEFIQFLDADDLLSLNKIETQIKILQQNKNAITTCNWVRFKNNTNETFGSVGPHKSISYNLKPVNWLLLQHTMLVHAWLCPKNIIDKAGGWNPQISYNDDGDFFFRAVANAENIIFVPNIFAYYRLNDSGLNLSNLNSEEKHYSAYLVSLTYKRILYKLTNKSAMAEQAFGNYLRNIVFNAYPKYNKIIQLCLKHPEIRLANISYESGGFWNKTFIQILGWKLTKRLKNFVRKI